MVEKHLRSRDITDKRVLRAMEKVRRDLFVPEALRERAYSDHPLPIGDDQTISQPYMVAYMSQALYLNGSEKVLEIGSGSGYQTAILAELSRSVFSVERIHRLASNARKILEECSYHNVSVRVANGLLGWKEFAPFDRIIITASVLTIPDTLINQLADGGRMIVPEGPENSQQKLYSIHKHGKLLEKKFLCYCHFVPCIG